MKSFDVIVRVDIDTDNDTVPSLTDYRAWGSLAQDTLDTDEVYDVMEVR